MQKVKVRKASTPAILAVYVHCTGSILRSSAHPLLQGDSFAFMTISQVRSPKVEPGSKKTAVDGLGNVIAATVRCQ